MKPKFRATIVLAIKIFAWISLIAAPVMTYREAADKAAGRAAELYEYGINNIYLYDSAGFGDVLKGVPYGIVAFVLWYAFAIIVDAAHHYISSRDPREEEEY